MSKERMAIDDEAPKAVTLNGRKYLRDPSGVLHELPESPIYEPQGHLDHLLDNGPSVEQPRKPRMRVRRKLGAGALAAGLIIVPVASHAGAEFATNSIINGIDPREDKVLNPDQLVADLGKTWGKMMKGEF